MNPTTRAPLQIVVMGVSGCGKSTIGTLLASALGLEFTDGDDLHPQASKEKMAAGIPLDDEDRWPWLDRVGQALNMPGGAVVACSALKRIYRQRILDASPKVIFVHLQGDRNLLLRRLNNRANHFMPLSLLDSQLEMLEPLASDETGMVLDISKSEKGILTFVIDQLRNEHF